MSTVRDHLWIWGHEAGSHNTCFHPPRVSRMTPMESACYMGIPNIMMVVYNNQPQPPFDQYALAMRPCKQIVWSCVGDSSSPRNDFDAFMSLTKNCPNLTGAIMDDFFPQPHFAQPRQSLSDVANYHRQLHALPKPLDLWVVLYDYQLMMSLNDYLEYCDVMTFWTWEARNLSRLEDNFKQVEKIAGKKRKVLGCYLYDYGTGALMPNDLMQYQCETGLKWLQEGQIEGMVFLASCICDLNLEAVEWTRRWITQVGGIPLENQGR